MPTPVTQASTFDWTRPRFMPVAVDVDATGVRLLACGETVKLEGSLFQIESDHELVPSWTVEEYDFHIFSLHLAADQTAVLKKIAWFAGSWTNYDSLRIHSTGVQDNFLFLRKGGVSFFLSLDFPSSTINEQGISYEPWEEVPAQSAYTCHTISVGACALSGIAIGDYDRAEIEAASAYVEQRYPLRFQRPVYLSTCITNHMTDVREGRIFYSMSNNPTLHLAPDVLQHEIDLCAEVGVEYFQVFEGVFDWPENDARTGDALRKLVAYGNERGVRIGDYVHPGNLYCPHYNYEQRHLERPEWRQLDPNGNRGQFCLGNKEYAAFLIEKLVAHNRKYGEQMICLDMLHITPCHDTAHEHPAGDVYHQVRGLVELMQALSDVHPEYLIWTNSGNWLDFMPKLVWYNPNIYLSDPHVREYSPNLNMLKLMGDTRREQMATIHNTHMVPYRFYSNCEYYYSKRSRVHDIHYFEYSLLQSLAVTPNVCLGEWRTFLDRIPSARWDGCVAFMRKWLAFIQDHYDVWQTTKQIGDSPGIGSMEAYAHMGSGHGFICLVNQNPFSGKLTFRLDGTIGLEAVTQYDLFEIYPQECPLLEQPLPYADYGTAITCAMPPHSVRYIAIKPHAQASALQVFGLPAVSARTEEGYRITLTAPQGTAISLPLLLPKQEAIAQASAQQVPTVPMYTFPAAAQLREQQGRAASIDVVFPRTMAPRELNQWTVQPGDVEITLPQLDSCPFLGALVIGAYSEQTEVWLDIEIETKPPNEADEAQKVQQVQQAGEEREVELAKLAESAEKAGKLEPSGSAAAISLPARQLTGQKHAFHTVFELPFVEWNAFAPGDDADAVIELPFTDIRHVRSIAATLNGEAVDVCRYPYATNKAWCSYFIELTGQAQPGTIHLVVEIEWASEASTL